jgi:type I restriction enzyme S subunit
MAVYKDLHNSDIDWLGSYPSHWKKIRLRYLCNITTGNKDTINKEPNGAYPFFVRSRKIERISSFAYDGEAILTAGDGDICKIWHHINGRFDFHQRVYMLYNFKDIFGKYLYYYISQNFYYAVFKLSAKNTVDSLRLPMFLNFPVLVPPIQEQEKIVSYLDNQTMLVDRIICSHQKSIDRLREKRQAEINEKVTKGLNQEVLMKDTNIEWLGAIPATWQLVKLRYLGKCQNGVSQSGDYFGSGDPFVSYSDIYRNEALPHSVEGKALSTAADKEQYSVIEGDVFFTRTSETVEEIGIASTCMKTIPGAVFAGFLIRFRPEQGLLEKGYSKYFFRSLVPRVHFSREMNLVTRASLSQELLKSLPVCLPELTEQSQIARYLDEMTRRTDEAIVMIKSAVDKLIEYRESIIAEVISGKKDVRDEDSGK